MTGRGSFSLMCSFSFCTGRAVSRTGVSAVLLRLNGFLNGSTTTVAGGEGPWAPVEEPTWEIGKDQAAKKDQGFPRPDEAYEVGEDPQKDARSPMKSNQGEKAEGKDGEASSSKDQGDGQGNLFTKPIVHSSQLTSSGVDFKGKRVLIRVDFNVPMAEGKVTNPAVRTSQDRLHLRDLHIGNSVSWPLCPPSNTPSTMVRKQMIAIEKWPHKICRCRQGHPYVPPWSSRRQG